MEVLRSERIVFTLYVNIAVAEYVDAIKSQMLPNVIGESSMRC